MQKKEKLLGNTADLLDFIAEMANLVCNEIKLSQLLESELFGYDEGAFSGNFQTKTKRLLILPLS